MRALKEKADIEDDVDLKEVAAATENFTGADLQAFIYNAQLIAIHDRFPSTPGSVAQPELSVPVRVFHMEDGQVVPNNSLTPEASALMDRVPTMLQNTSPVESDQGEIKQVRW